MGPWYCTREAVKQAAQIRGSDEHIAIDRLLESASREIERILERTFYPLTATRYYGFPSKDMPHRADFELSPPDFRAVSDIRRDAGLYRLWLNADLLSIETLEADEVEVTEYFLEPINTGPPYRYLELDLDVSVRFEPGSSQQRAISIEGVWGYCDAQAAAGTLASGIDDAVAAADVSDSSLIGVGDFILIGTERLTVTEKALLTTAATVNMVGNIAAEDNVVAITVDDGTKVKQGETVTIDAERMLVESIAGNVLTVKRAMDASTLAAHDHGATVYAPRTLTVERAAAGTTAAAHLAAAAITRNVPPGLIAELCLAETIYARTQEKGHMALTAGQGEGVREISGKGIADVRKRAREAYGKRRRRNVRST